MRTKVQKYKMCSEFIVTVFSDGMMPPNYQPGAELDYGKFFKNSTKLTTVKCMEPRLN